VRILLVEAEVWPNLVAFAHANRVPIALVNARLSPKSERRFQRFRFFVAPTFQLLDLVCVQEPEDADRWQRIGVDRSRIKCTGSIKYDPDVQGPSRTVAPSLWGASDRAVLFGGSTHRGEEEILAKLFIAPRHVERLPEIRAQLEALGLHVALASETRPAGKRDDADCVLLDTTGELQQWYNIARVVFIGKSLTAHGGQNPVEPILAGKPVVFGPHMENFARLAAALVSKKGAIQVRDSDSLERVTIELLLDSELRQQLVQNAHQALARHQGATARATALVHDLKPV